MNAQRRKQLDSAIQSIKEARGKIDDAKSIIEDMGNEEREYYDNMSENLQGGEKGEKADAAATALEEAASTLEEMTSSLDAIEENIDTAKE